jgi:predicted GH43/DUF377 family glycosyl hydrolase
VNFKKVRKGLRDIVKILSYCQIRAIMVGIKSSFNPAVLYDGKKIHMLYRAVGEYERYVSRVGYAFSEDGFNFKRTKSVVLGPNEGYEKYGTEDPRLIEIDNRVYVSYVVLSDYVTSGPINSSTALATTDDYYHHTRLGIITGRGSDNKDVVLFPERINREFYMFIMVVQIWCVV